MQKGAFVQVHVSGLPHVCSDSDVEAELRRAVIGAPVVTSQSAPGYLAVESCDIEEPTADAQAAGSPVVVEAVAADLAAAADPVTIPLADGASACEGLPTVSDGGEDSPIADEELRLLAAFVTCVVVRNKDTQECKGYCFLTFETASEAERAIDVLNSGVDIVGARVSAQISLPKERHAKPKDPSQDIGDLRLRRARYACVGKKAQYGHLDPSNGQKKYTPQEAERPDRNSAGRQNLLAGTRGGKPLVLDEGKRPTRLAAAVSIKDHRGL